MALEKLGANFLSSLLTGKGPQAVEQAIARGAFPRRFVHTTGSVLGPALDAEFLSHTPRPGFLQNSARHIRSLFIGERPGDILRQRMMQGGILGKGGIVRGQYALPSTIAAALEGPSPVKTILENHKLDALNALANTTVMAGIPAFAGYHALTRDDKPELGRVVGDTLGWTVGAPFGAAGMLIAAPIAALGRQLGKQKPPQPQPYPQQYQQQYPPDTAQQYQPQYPQQYPYDPGLAQENPVS